MKKLIFIIGILVTILSVGCFTNTFASEKVIVNKDKLGNGIIKIGFISDNNKAIRVMIKKGDTSYVYSLKNNGTMEAFSLQMGNGNYNIFIFENIQGNLYNPVYSMTVNVNISDDKVVFLNPIQNINWDDTMGAIKKAEDLTKTLKSDDDKLNAIYNYIIPNFKYDYVKWKNINSYPNPYIPVVDQTYADKKGICYDYSSLFAAMLRSVNIPTKLVMGYTKNVAAYHAWNEVYLSSSKKWVIVDTTYDSQMKASDKKFKMVKDTGEYSQAKDY